MEQLGKRNKICQGLGTGNNKIQGTGFIKKMDYEGIEKSIPKKKEEELQNQGLWNKGTLRIIIRGITSV